MPICDLVLWALGCWGDFLSPLRLVSVVPLNPSLLSIAVRGALCVEPHLHLASPLASCAY